MADPPPAIAPIKVPAAPAAPATPTLAFGNCKSDDEALAKVPARNVEDPAYRKRGVVRSKDWFPTTRKVTAGNEIIPYVNGKCAFADMSEALKTAFLPEHRIYLIGWSVDKGVQLVPGAGGTLEDHLKNSRAQIRGLFYDGRIAVSPLVSINTGVENKWIADMINNLPNGAAVIDGRLPPLGIHHQKALVVQGIFGLVAFLGGMDLAPSRVTVNPAAGEPWHDVQVRITGPAALDVRQIFEDRWMDHPTAATRDERLSGTTILTTDARRKIAFPDPARLDRGSLPSTTWLPGATKSRSIDAYATIGRTFASNKAGGTYTFASAGDYSAWEMIEHGIARAQRWIYLEDQYLVSRMARKALLAKLADPSFEYLLMVMNGSGAAASDFKFLVTQRNEFRRDLLKIDPQRKRWGMYVLKDSGDPERQKVCGTYLHSKTWIFDDGYVIVGSANCDNRGYTLDTECVVGFSDANTLDVFLGKSYAVELRTRLWRKHIGLPHSQLRDFDKAIRFWRQPPPSAMIVDASGFEIDSNLTPPAQFPSSAEAPAVETAWTTFIDPDAR
ncbi:phospholipase D-like domain-containing protein [Gordonia sp. CPCC 205333]|uniref:phospholipase D-like domain-containing protein n=1 Tax=Gordonia sp. CPCC 205333 TaxID=3140790 RepID=UPI003AF33558